MVADGSKQYEQPYLYLDVTKLFTRNEKKLNGSLCHIMNQVLHKMVQKRPK